MQVVPENRWERAEWLEANFDHVLAQLPMDSPFERLSEFECKLFPTRCLLPLDPACPECGAETEDGSVERKDDGFEVRYDCGHVFVLSERELHARMQVDGRDA